MINVYSYWCTLTNWWTSFRSYRTSALGFQYHLTKLCYKPHQVPKLKTLQANYLIDTPKHVSVLQSCYEQIFVSSTLRMLTQQLPLFPWLVLRMTVAATSVKKGWAPQQKLTSNPSATGFPLNHKLQAKMHECRSKLHLQLVVRLHVSE